MILILCGDDVLYRSIARELRGWPSERVEDSSDLLKLLAAATVVILAVPEVSDDLLRLARRCEQGALAPHVIIVTALEASTVMRTLSRVAPTMSVVWRDELAPLSTVVRRVNSNPVRVVCANAAERPEFSPLLVRAFRSLANAPVPPVSVRALAAGLAVRPGSLRYYWREEIRRSSPKVLVGWSTLLRAMEIRRTLGWTGAARRLGLHRRSIERIAKRLTGLPPGRLYRARQLGPALFRQWAVQTLGPSVLAMRPQLDEGVPLGEASPGRGEWMPG